MYQPDYLGGVGSYGYGAEGTSAGASPADEPGGALRIIDFAKSQGWNWGDGLDKAIEIYQQFHPSSSSDVTYQPPPPKKEIPWLPIGVGVAALLGIGLFLRMRG